MFSSTFVAIAPTFAFCEYAPKLCKWFEIWMTPPKNLSLNPPCVLQIDYLITEALRYFSCVRGKILAERFPVPLLAGCLLWCDRRSLSVQGRRRCEALGMFTATILKQYVRVDSSDCSSSHITVWTLLSYFHSTRLSKTKLAGLGDWVNFVFWVIFSKIFNLQIISGQVHWLKKPMLAYGKNMPRNNQFSGFLPRKNYILPRKKICPNFWKIYKKNKNSPSHLVQPFWLAQFSTNPPRVNVNTGGGGGLGDWANFVLGNFLKNFQASSTAYLWPSALT